MTQNEFFNILMDELKDIPESRLYIIICYYQNYFFNNTAYGKSEEEITSELEDPKLIAERILNGSSIENQFTPESLILSSHAKDKSEPASSHANNNKTIFNTNSLLKFAIIMLFILVLFPIVVSIGSVLFNTLKLCIQIIIESLDLAVGINSKAFIHLSIIPNFISEMPQNALAAFSIGTIFLSLFFIFIIFYFIKLIYIMINNLIDPLRKKKGD